MCIYTHIYTYIYIYIHTYIYIYIYIYTYIRYICCICVCIYSITAFTYINIVPVLIFLSVFLSISKVLYNHHFQLSDLSQNNLEKQTSRQIAPQKI